MSIARALVLVLAMAGVAVADPAADPVPAPPALTLQTQLFVEKTPTPIPSLRIEAARVAQERFAEQWRYPEPGTLGSYDGTGIFFGEGRYRPRSRRAAALRAGSIGATLLGEILLAADSPLAGLGALAAGATLDAAVADSDRDAEARRPQ